MREKSFTRIDVKEKETEVRARSGLAWPHVFVSVPQEVFLDKQTMKNCRFDHCLCKLVMLRADLCSFWEKLGDHHFGVLLWGSDWLLNQLGQRGWLLLNVPTGCNLIIWAIGFQWKLPYLLNFPEYVNHWLLLIRSRWSIRYSKEHRFFFGVLLSKCWAYFLCSFKVIAQAVPSSTYLFFLDWERV